MSDRLELIVNQFEIHNRLFANVTRELDENAGQRPRDTVNHVGWIAGHLVSTRHMLANILGLGIPEPFPKLFENGKGIDPQAEYPPLKRTREDFEAISAPLIGKLRSLTTDVLEADAPFQVPTGGKMDKFIAFFAHHEAYHIGQIGILRRYFDHEAMSYQ